MTIEPDRNENQRLQSVFKNLDVSILKFKNTFCDLCGCEDSKLVHKPSFVGLEFRFCRCKNCGLIYQNPLLDRESREHLYESKEYWNFKDFGKHQDKILNYYSYISEVDNRLKTNEYRVKWIVPRLAPNSRILDLACGDGLFIDKLNKLGYEGYGMDVSSSIITVAREKYGVNIMQGDLEKEWPFTEPFDAITCYTPSNLIKPSIVFQKISQHLRVGGYFFFNFADCDNFFSSLLGSRFYVYRPCTATAYSKKTFNAYLEGNGFVVEQIEKDIQQIPLKRLFGMLGFPSVIKGLDFFGLGSVDIKIALPTSYIGCAVLRDQ